MFAVQRFNEELIKTLLKLGYVNESISVCWCLCVFLRNIHHHNLQRSPWWSYERRDWTEYPPPAYPLYCGQRYSASTWANSPQLWSWFIPEDGKWDRSWWLHALPEMDCLLFDMGSYQFFAFKRGWVSWNNFLITPGKRDREKEKEKEVCPLQGRQLKNLTFVTYTKTLFISATTT